MDTTADRRVQSVLVVLVAVSLVCSCSQTAMKVRQTSVAAPANILICAAIAPLRPTPGPSIPVDVVEFLWKTMEQDPEAGGFWTDDVAGGGEHEFHEGRAKEAGDACTRSPSLSISHPRLLPPSPEQLGHSRPPYAWIPSREPQPYPLNRDVQNRPRACNAVTPVLAAHINSYVEQD